MPKIVFVCSSDRTRSPMAAAVFQHLAQKAGLTDWEIDSAGLRAQHGQMIADEVRTVLAEKGIQPLRIGVQLLTPKLIKAADLLVPMTTDQEHELTSQFISARHKTKCLMSITEAPTEIFDPNHLGVEKFRECLALMWPALEELVKRLS